MFASARVGASRVSGAMAYQGRVSSVPGHGCRFFSESKVEVELRRINQSLEILNKEVKEIKFDVADNSDRLHEITTSVTAILGLVGCGFTMGVLTHRQVSKTPSSNQD